ncbi:MAG: hypothetical protein WD689_06850 [Gaiellaceae bacterium]
MPAETSSERIERLLTQRLDELAQALERSGAPADSVGRLLELAATGTLTAVALELLHEQPAEQPVVVKEAQEALPERRAA